MVRRSEGAKLEAALRRKDKAQARDLRRDAHSHSVEAAVLTRGARKTRETAKARRARVRATCKALRAKLRVHHREERERERLALKARQRAELDDLAARCKAARAAIPALYRSKREQAKALRLEAASERAQAKALMERHRTEAQHRAGRNLSEMMDEAIDVARNAVEGHHPEWLPIFNEWASSQKRRAAAYKDARALYTKHNATRADKRRAADRFAIGEKIGEWFLEYVAEHPDVVQEWEQRQIPSDDELAREYLASEAKARGVSVEDLMREDAPEDPAEAWHTSGADDDDDAATFDPSTFDDEDDAPAPKRGALLSSAEYQQREAARVERLRGRAEKLRQEGAAKLSASRAQVAGIPMGQPILVGHHSEARHRRDLARADALAMQGVAAHREAERVERRAQAAEQSTAIHSDDPDAPAKLAEKATRIEREIARAKQINAAIRSAGRRLAPGWRDRASAALEAIGLPRQSILDALTPDPLNNVGVPAYHLRNLDAELRRVRRRAEDLIDMRARTPATFPSAPGVTMTIEGGRVRLTFAGKPDEATRGKLKARAFKWAPSVGAWVRKDTEGARAVAAGIVRDLAAAAPRECGAPVLGSDDIVRPCELPPGHGGWHEAHAAHARASV